MERIRPTEFQRTAHLILMGSRSSFIGLPNDRGLALSGPPFYEEIDRLTLRKSSVETTLWHRSRRSFRLPGSIHEEGDVVADFVSILIDEDQIASQPGTMRILGRYGVEARSQ